MAHQRCTAAPLRQQANACSATLLTSTRASLSSSSQVSALPLVTWRCGCVSEACHHAATTAHAACRAVLHNSMATTSSAAESGVLSSMMRVPSATQCSCLPLPSVSRYAHVDSLPLVSRIASDRQTCIILIQDCLVSVNKDAQQRAIE